jgi:hypothetical protein
MLFDDEVVVNGKSVKLSTLQIGDYVGNAEVLNIERRRCKGHFLGVKFEGGAYIRGDQNVELLTKRGYINSKDLFPSDEVLIRGEWKKFEKKINMDCLNSDLIFIEMSDDFEVNGVRIRGKK